MANWENILTGIGYGLNFLGSMGTNIWNNAISNNANEQQERLQDRANAFSLDMWNRENAYNHPAAQMERLKQAGINPAMAYANGVQNTAGGAPSSVQPNDAHRAKMENPFSDFDKLATDFATMKLKTEEAKLTGEKIKSTQQQFKIGEKTLVQMDENLKLTVEQRNVLAKEGDKLSRELELIDEKVNYYRNLSNKESYEAGLSRLNYLFHKSIKDDRVQKYKADLKLTEEQSRYYDALVQYYFQQVILGKAEKRLLDINIEKGEKELFRFGDMIEMDYQSGLLEFNIRSAKADWFLDHKDWVIPFETIMEGVGSVVNVGIFGKLAPINWSKKRPKIGF